LGRTPIVRDSILKERLRQALDEEGRRQNFIAHKLGLNPTTVHNWCNLFDTRNPVPEKHEQAVADIVGRDLAWLKGLDQ